MGVKQPKGNPYEREYRRGHDRGYAKGIAAENKRLMEVVCERCGGTVGDGMHVAVDGDDVLVWHRRDGRASQPAKRITRAEYERRTSVRT